jgi:hypothetical protein
MENIGFYCMELQQMNHNMYRTLRPISKYSLMMHMNTVTEIKLHIDKGTNMLPSVALGMNLGTNRRLGWLQSLADGYQHFGLHHFYPEGGGSTLSRMLVTTYSTTVAS